MKSPVVLFVGVARLHSDAPTLTVPEAKKYCFQRRNVFQKNTRFKVKIFSHIPTLRKYREAKRSFLITYNNFEPLGIRVITKRKGLKFLGHPPLIWFNRSLGQHLYAVPLVQIDKRAFARFQKCYLTLEVSKATVWISTPSFQEMCLGVDPSFKPRFALPELEQFVFCGEKLFSTTVEN